MNKITRIIILGSIAGVLSIYGFNCSQQEMKGADYSESSFSSTGGPVAPHLSGAPFSDTADETAAVPRRIGNFEQIFKSMLNLTGQATSTAAQRTEFNARVNSFPDNNRLGSINPPVMLSATSLAGQVCFDLVNKERALAAVDRDYFETVNFAAGLAQFNTLKLSQAINPASQIILGRGLASDEQTMFDQFATEFVAASTNPTSAAQTVALVTASCAALLSSFDSLTY